MKTIELPFQKVENPVSFEQIEEMKKFDNVTFSVSSSQLLKRLDEEQYNEIIEALESGESVEIKG